MTVNRLSAQSAKVQLKADELRIFLTTPEDPAESPQMLRLISFLLLQAESATGIPFSSVPVTVELLRTQDGGLAGYFTVQETAAEPHTSGVLRMAARFPDQSTLKQCCQIMQQKQNAILTSRLYRYRKSLVLELKSRQQQAGWLHHLLLEYGSPFRLSAMNRARLTEYGSCIYESNAVAEILSATA